MSLEEKLALLEETLETDDGYLKPEMELDDIEEYTSITKLALIVMMDDEFGVKLSSEEVRAFKTVKDILDKMN